MRRSPSILFVFLAALCALPSATAQQPIFPGLQSYVGNGTHGLVVGDFDSDGDLDIAAANIFSQDVTVILGKADSRFDPLTSYYFGGDMNGLAVGDMDGDLDLDLISVSSTWNSAFVLEGNGDGTFVGPSAPFNPNPVGLGATDIVVLDLDDDGDLDVVVTSFIDNSVSVLLGNGDLTLGSAVSYAVGGGPSGVDFADVNEDTIPDVIVSNQTSGDISVLLGTGAGSFLPQQVTDILARPTGLTVGDVDGDGHDDVIIAGNNGDWVEIVPGDGNGNFGRSYTVPTAEPVREVELADLNGDGHLDILAGTSSRHFVSVLISDGEGGFKPHREFYGKYNPFELATGDIDQDGVLDVIAGTFFDGFDGPSFAAVLLGVGDGTLSAPDVYDIVATERVLKHGDFDEDGLPDLAVGHATGLACGILRGNGDGTYTQIGVYSLDGGAANDIDIADVNNDGHLDIATALRNLDACGVLLGNGDGTFQDNVLYDVGINPRGVDISTDVNGDGFRDLAGANKWNLPDMGSVTIRLNNGDGTFAPGTNYLSGSDTLYVIFEDIDGDGIKDMTSCNLESWTVTFRHSFGDGTFGEPTFISLHNGVVDGWPSRHYFEDLDGDGDRDMIAAGMKGEGMILCESNGDGTFQQAVHFPVGAVPEQSRFIVTADVDNDGDPDVLLPTDGLHSNGPARICVLLNEGNLNFAPEDAYAAGNRPYDIDLVDLDRDGWLDAANASYQDSMVTVYINQLSPYRNLGHELPGTGGLAPHCVGYGSMEAGTTAGFRLTRALPGSFTYLAIGLNRIDVPFYGGTLVPDYDYVLILPVDGIGFADALGTWPADVPSGFEVYAQFWVPDPGAIYELAGSNAVIGVTP